MMRRKGKRRPVRDYVIAGVLAIVVCWLCFMVVDILGKEERARRAASEAETNIESLTEREATLRANLEDLNTPRGQEASLRETYGVARPGEEVIILVQPGEGEELQELSWWQKFLGFFGL